MIGTIFNLLGALGVFLYGMRVMSEGLQKVAGDKLQKVLNFITNNRFTAIMTGFIITSLIQSSSATTVMVVSFVNASLLSLTQAIGVIMGANIGTTITTWIVSFVGFKFKVTAIALPIVGIALPFIFSKNKKNRDFGEILIGFGLLFLGLLFLKESVPDIKHHPEILSFLQNYTNHGFLSFVIFVFVGSVLTVIVQSSSAAMAITVTMAFKGWIDFPTAAAIALGENIGTTVTAYLASIGTNVNARRSARAHFFFNVFGVIWMAFAFHLFTKDNGIIYNIAKLFWNPELTNAQGQHINFPLNVALFHSVFNILNTLLFIPFVPQFSKFVENVVKPKASDLRKKYELKYISTGIQDTAELNILKAKQEIIKMSAVAKDMFLSFLDIFNNPDKKIMNKVEKIKESEELTDRMQEEISKFMVECSKEELSDTAVNNVNAMMRIVHELENIGDSCYKLALLSQRRYNKNLKIALQAITEINDYARLIMKFIEFYDNNLNRHLDKSDLQTAYQFEKEINNNRNLLRKAARRRLQEGSDVKTELLYLDLLKNLEHIGDNALNISQALEQIH